MDVGCVGWEWLRIGKCPVELAPRPLATGALLVLWTASGKTPPRQHPALPHSHRCWIWWFCHKNKSPVLSSCLWSAPSPSSSHALPSHSQTSTLPSLFVPYKFFFYTCPTHSCLLTRLDTPQGSWSLRGLNVFESPSDIIYAYLSLFLTDHFQFATAPVHSIMEDEPKLAWSLVTLPPIQKFIRASVHSMVCGTCLAVLAQYFHIQHLSRFPWRHHYNAIKRLESSSGPDTITSHSNIKNLVLRHILP